jgi:hypothetical protein
LPLRRMEAKKKKPATDAADVDGMTDVECREALKQLLDEKRQREEALPRTIDPALPSGPANGGHDAGCGQISTGNGIVPKEPKRGRKRCRHGKAQKSKCKECGSGCPHGKIKYSCGQCRALLIACGEYKGKGRSRKREDYCRHGRFKRVCKECGGRGICKHFRQKTHCKECGGSAICAHGRQRSTCKECGGSTICAHGRRKHECKECGITSRRKDTALGATVLAEFHAALRGEPCGE